MSAWEPSPELHRLSCERCGGSFELVGLRASVSCPYCAHPQQVPPAVLQRLEAYGSAVNEAQSREAAHHSMVERHGAVSRSGRAAMAIYILMLVVLVIGGVVLMLGAGDPGVMVAGGMIGIYGLLFIGVVAIVLSMIRRRCPNEALGGRFTAVCPSCGAPDELALGQMHRTCSHCRVNLVPSDAVVAAALGVAEANVRAAGLAKLRSERAMFARIADNGRAFGVLQKYFMMLLPVGLTIVWHHQARMGHVAPEQPLGWGAISLVVLVGFGVHHSLRVRRRRAWSEPLDSLGVAHPGAASITDLRSLITWLDSYWTETYGKGYKPRNSGGPDLQATALYVRGFPVMVVVWSPFSRKQGFVDILVAGVRQSEQHPHAKAHREAAKALGFAHRKKVTAGIQLIAEREGFEALAANPNRSQALHAALHAAVELAVLTGYVPAPPA